MTSQQLSFVESRTFKATTIGLLAQPAFMGFWTFGVSSVLGQMPGSSFFLFVIPIAFGYQFGHFQD
jgi:hypothetical protein